MNQRTHSWIAIRAIALLEEDGREKGLVKLLKPNAAKASVGAWIPDKTDAKRSGNSTDNHIFKIEPYKGGQKERFVTQKHALLEHIGTHRKVYKFIQNDATLPDQWWNDGYKAEISRPGQHLPNRAMALGTMMKDILLMGDDNVDDLLPGKVEFAKNIDAKARTSGEASSTYFFMLSHFIADASMPFHCDGRKLAGYEEGIHKELEAHWSKKSRNLL